MECITFVEVLHVPDIEKAVGVKSLYACLQEVSDRRGKRGRRYRAAVVVTIMLLAKLAGKRV